MPETILERLELEERVWETAWRRGSLETNHSLSRVRGARALSGRGWGIYSTSDARVPWEEIESRAQKLAQLGSSKQAPLVSQAELYTGRVELGRPSPSPEDSLLRLIAQTRGLLEEKGLTGELVALYVRRVRRIGHSQGEALEDKRLSELYVFAEVEAQGRRNVGSAMRAWMGPPEALPGRELEALVETASRRAVWGLRSEALSPLERGQKTVILGGEASAALFHELSHLLEADQPDHLAPGSRVFSLGISISDDPYEPTSPSSRFFDDEGVKAPRRTLVEGGSIVDLLHTRETAGSGGRPGSAYGLFHKPKALHTSLRVTGGDWRDREIIEETRRGVLVDGVVRAELSQGIVRIVPEEAWVVEKGEVRKPIRISEVKLPLLRSLTSIDAVGKKLYTRTSYEKGHLQTEKVPWVRLAAYVF